MQFCARRDRFEAADRALPAGAKPQLAQIQMPQSRGVRDRRLYRSRRQPGGFRALLVGYYDPQGKLRYAGRVGTGFNTGQLIQLHRQLEVSGATGANRHLAQRGLAQRRALDRAAPRRRSRIRDLDGGRNCAASLVPGPARGQGRQRKWFTTRNHELQWSLPPEPKKTPARPKQAASKEAETDEPERARDGSLIFEGVRLTHPDRILYPGTSAHQARCRAVLRGGRATGSCRNLAHRILTLVRSPAAGMKTFYQKHIGDEAPEAIKRFNIDG